MAFGFRKKKNDKEYEEGNDEQPVEKKRLRLKYTVPDSPVFKAWLTLIITSIVSLISIASQKPDAGHETWVTIATAVSFVFSFFMFFGYNWSREKLEGSKSEGVISLIILLFWIAAFPSIMHLTMVTVANGVMGIANANLYFSSWASFAVSMNLVIQILPNLFERLEAPEENGKTSKMVGLFIASVVLMVSAIEYASDFCSESNGSTCSRNSYAISVGAIGIVNAFIALILKVLKKSNLLMEAIFSAVMFILYIFGVGFVTFGEGPGSLTVSNLYFSPWVGFIFSYSLAFESIRAYMKDRGGNEDEEEYKEDNIEAQEAAPPSVNFVENDSEKRSNETETEDYGNTYEESSHVDFSC